MKRMLMSVITVYLLFACLISNAALAESVQDNDIQLLVDLGVIKEEIKTELNKPIQRMAFADMFSSAENVKGAAALLTPKFADVDLSADYADALSWLCISGAVTEDEFFYPENNITRGEAAKIMVTVLGYGREAVFAGGYPDGYIKTASRLRLFDGVGSGEFTVSDACKMFKNALDVRTAAIENGTYDSVITDLTMLERFYNVRFAKGKMTKNTQTKLIPELSDSNATVAVENNEYICTQKYDDLIGRNVTVYYSTRSAEENEVVGIYESKKNTAVHFEADDNVSFSDYTYEVYNNTNKAKKYKIARSIDVVYNGRVYTQYNEEELLPENGDVTLIDSESDGKYETVIINAYEVYAAGNGTGDGLIYDKMGKEVIDLNNNCDYVINEGGEPAALSAISAGDLLEVRKSRGEADRFIQIDIIRNIVSGELTSVKDSYDSRILTVNGVGYPTTKEVKDLIDSKSWYLDEIKIGMETELYLDRNGRVGYFTSENSERTFYTYLRRAGIDDSKDEDSVFFRIILPDGSWSTVYAAKKVKVNGEKRKTSDLAIDVASGAFKSLQPIQCKLNKDGAISMINTLEKYDLGYERLTYKRGSRTFDGYISISNDCKVFVVPGAGYEQDESMYEVRNAGYFREGENYTFDAYEVNDALVADVVIIRGNGKNTNIPSKETFMIVDSVCLTAVEDEACAEIETITPNGRYTGITKDGTVEFVDRLTGKYMSFYELNKGDLIRVLCDNAGKIINGERLVDFNKFKTDKKRGAYTMDGGYRDGLILRGGFVYASYEDIIAVTKNAEIDLESADIMKNLFVYSAQTPSILVYDMKENTARTGSMNDIISYKDFNSKSLASFVYIQTVLGDPKCMVVYK